MRGDGATALSGLARRAALFRARRYASETHAGVNILRCPLLLRAEMRGIWRLLAPLSFAVTSAPLTLWKIVTERPAIVLCIEPTFFVAPIALLARFSGARVILHVQDLEIDAAFAVGHLRGDRLRNFALWLEPWLLRRFSSIVTISSQMRKRLIDKGVEANRIGLVRNWVDVTKIKPLAGPNVFRTELGLTGADFVVLYAGNIGPKQALDVVLDAARQLAYMPQVHFVSAEHEAKWLPAPAGDYYLILRAYAPGEALIRAQSEPNAFPLPPITLVE